MRSATAVPAVLLVWTVTALGFLASAASADARQLTADEQVIVEHVHADIGHGIDLLERTVNINSGTLNLEGVRVVAEEMRPEFEALGFEVEWIPLPAELNRAGHLIAERRGERGQRLLIIGHLDTVFDEDSPFQRFEIIEGGSAATGPGVVDMKGGNMVIVQALRALDAAGALEGTTITVVLTGDEESAGRPLDISRRDLIEAALRSDIALGFEGGSRDDEGILAVVARRGSSPWRLTTTGRRAHSSVIFSDDVGAGAIFEAARILNDFYDEIRGEEFLTFNAGNILGGSEVEYDERRAAGTAYGRSNVVPRRVVVHGGLRTISQEQLDRSRERMRQVVERSLPGTSAEIEFEDAYPAMSPTEGNYALLERFDQVSRDLGYPAVRAFDPARRGAADISFVAPYVDGIDGLGPFGSGSHTEDETVDLETIPDVIERAAIFIYRLTR